MTRMVTAARVHEKELGEPFIQLFAELQSRFMAAIAVTNVPLLLLVCKMVRICHCSVFKSVTMTPVDNNNNQVNV